ncbi:hypothetical protein ABZ626_07200 [Streptomyces longispororuber]|uniref:hypothetical protein n=1 Tax=Streptomyces longispororuber TaxID=68230 RepID=UPI0033CAE06F
MTQQSGQGAASSDPRQPAERHAHEGIVLPADGGEPLMPGGHQAAPPVGSPWGEPWGPAAPQSQDPGESWGGAQHPEQGTGAGWSAAPQQDSAAPRMPLPPEGAPLPPSAPPGTPPSTPPTGGGGYGYPMQGQGQAHGQAHGQAQSLPSAEYGGAYPMPGQGQPLPPTGQGAPGAAGGYGEYGPPAAGPGQPQPGAGPVPPGSAAEHTQVLRPVDAGQQGQQGYSGPSGQSEHPGQGGHGRHGRHAGPASHATPGSHGGPGSHGSPGSHAGPASHAGPGSHAAPASQAGPGGHPGPQDGPDAQATQYIPPVGPGALPPEMPAGDATQFLGRADATQFLGRAADVVPEEGAFPGDNAPTQYIAPVTDTGPPPASSAGHGERQPPAEFDSLFRREPEGASSTQQMPRVEALPPEPAPEPEPRRRGRTRSKTPLIVAVGVAIAVIGVGAGAMLASGGGDAKAEDKEPTAVSSSQDEDGKDDDGGKAKPSPSADPAKKQAVALDKLLADSNDSRQSVIDAVRDVGRCQNLRQAASDLRAAARQRNGLVGRLAELEVGELPAHGRLTTALNRAWRASASADNHYAAWAGQVAGKKGCRKGHARPTPQQAAGNRASGEATRAKQQAAELWNAIADKHGLTKRTPTQL